MVNSTREFNTSEYIGTDSALTFAFKRERFPSVNDFADAISPMLSRREFY